MNCYPFLQVDVFTSTPFGGNQLAVFTDARRLSSDQMQALAREMNFSETTFVLPPETPGGHKRVRIFTPAIEMPMAGHPTVGTAASLVHRGLVELPSNHTIVLELGIGPVEVEIEPRETGMPFAWMNHRMPEFGPTRTDREAVAHALGLEPADVRDDLPLQVVSTGVPFLFVPLRSLEAIGRSRSESTALNHLFRDQPQAHVALFTEEVLDPTARVHARMYSPHYAGIVEDAATGSMAAPFGAYLAQHGVLASQPEVIFKIEQGIEMGRPSQITVQVVRDGSEFRRLRIGGDSVLVGEGTIYWE